MKDANLSSEDLWIRDDNKKITKLFIKKCLKISILIMFGDLLLYNWSNDFEKSKSTAVCYTAQSYSYHHVITTRQSRNTCLSLFFSQAWLEDSAFIEPNGSQILR